MLFKYVFNFGIFDFVVSGFMYDISFFAIVANA